MVGLQEDDDLPDAPHISEPCLKSHEFARSNRSKCFVCKATIAKSSFRIQYRHRRSLAMEHLSWVHGDCAHGLPLDTRVLDKQAVHRFLLADGLPADARERLEAVLVQLS